MSLKDSLAIKANPASSKEAALKAARANAAQNNPSAIAKWISPKDAKEKIRIVFDDSGSMMGEKITQAREGTIEFMRNCVPNTTAVSVHFLCTHSEKLATLSTNLIEIAATLKEMDFKMGGTPLFGTMKATLELDPTLTHMVAFSDGSPTDGLVPYTTPPAGTENATLWHYKQSADIIIVRAVELGVPIDTVFFGPAVSYTEDERALLQYIAAETGGFYMVFDPQKVNFRTAFKYLAPTHRLMLASESVRKEIESGRRS